MPATWVMLQLLSFGHPHKVKGSWGAKPYCTCVLTEITARGARRPGLHRSPGRTAMEAGEALILHRVQSREPKKSGSCFPLRRSPLAATTENRLHGTRVKSDIFATHILGIKYSFLTSPSKVTGKLSNSLVSAVGELEECKKFLGFEIKICRCAYEIFTFVHPYHPLQLLPVQRDEGTQVKHCPGNMTTWPAEGSDNLPITHNSRTTYMRQLQTDVEIGHRGVLVNGHLQNDTGI